MPDLRPFPSLFGGKVVIYNASTRSTGGAQTQVEFRPASGKRLVLGAFGYHEENASRNCTWWITDGTNDVLLATTSRGQSERHSLHSYTGNPADPAWLLGPLVITHDQYLVFQVSSLGNGEDAFIEVFELAVVE